MLETNQNNASALGPMPDTTVSVREVFGLDVDITVPAYSQHSERVPELDPTYIFDKRLTIGVF